jgi:ribosomal protein S18 acetylase RimI-like enzyme
LPRKKAFPLATSWLLFIMSPRTRSGRARHWCEIDQIAVDPNYRRRGIARSLNLKAIAEIRTEGIRDIEATSWFFNEETHEVFRRLGFLPKTVRFEFKSSS